MANRVVQVETAHVSMTGITFLVYGQRYREAALTLLDHGDPNVLFDPVQYFLFCQALELQLKSYIWLKDGKSIEQLKNTYGHDIVKLWRHAKARGIGRFAAPTALRDRVIGKVGPYYKNRQLNYQDLDMTFRGFQDLQSEHQVIPALNRLTEQLASSLHTPVLRAS